MSELKVVLAVGRSENREHTNATLEMLFGDAKAPVDVRISSAIALDNTIKLCGLRILVLKEKVILFAGQMHTKGITWKQAGEYRRSFLSLC